MSSAAVLFAENLYSVVFVVLFFYRNKNFQPKIADLILKLKKQVWKFLPKTKMADFRKNAENWKHC